MKLQAARTSGPPMEEATMSRQHATQPLRASHWARALSRRTLLRGAAVTGLGAAAAALGGRSGAVSQAAAPATAQAPDWSAFDQAVRAALPTFDIPGAAVAVVNAAGTVHSSTFGVRNLATREPVTPATLFRVGSTTKAMTALMVATFVDEGLLTWDQSVSEIWPDFRAPTEELTRRLRVRDLLGMDTGLGEPAATFLHSGYLTVLGLLQSVAFLPSLGPLHTTYFYNNTVYAAGGYLPLLRQGTDPDALLAAYDRLMQERVYGPAGMRSARIGDDPRPFSDDYAIGYAVDFVEGTAAAPWAPIAGFAPAGATLAGLTDVAAFLQTQLRHGVAPSGTRVVSAGNLEECWQPHIDVPTSAILGPDLLSAGYGMGWVQSTYRGGRREVWHTGGIDGFATLIGFFPEDDLGLIVLTSREPDQGGSLFHFYVSNLLLERAFGLNQGANEAVVAAYRDGAGQLADLAAAARPVDAGAIAPYLGYYERGFRLAFDAAGALRLHEGSRATRVLAMPDGSYVAASGIFAGLPIRFGRDQTGVPVMELEGMETVSWSSGPA
jgi:CubicO group peptidase (beta-lactamase class C family)